MRAVVVCESWFGNTELLARAITGELERHGEAALVSVRDEIDAPEEVDLLAAAMRPSTSGIEPRSRASGISQASASSWISRSPSALPMASVSSASARPSSRWSGPQSATRRLSSAYASAAGSPSRRALCRQVVQLLSVAARTRPRIAKATSVVETTAAGYARDLLVED